jgi:anti-sigma B factor antagonist
MQIDIAEEDGTTIVRPLAERVDIEVAAELRSALLSLIERGRRRLIVDLNDVAFIDSSGLGALVAALKALKRIDDSGDVRLARVQPGVASLLEVIRLDRVFTSFASVDLAIASFH